MKPPRSHLSISPIARAPFVVAVAMAVAFATGCGTGGPSPTSAPGPSGSTSVTILATSTANDQLAEFNLVVKNLSLTSQSGKMVNLFSAPMEIEFIHVNGAAEPLVTVNVPQDVYTSATASIGLSLFDCIGLSSPDSSSTVRGAKRL